MEKAERAYLSARALIELGDADGACNRAYYAMFDAAKATLLALVDGPHIGVGKTHAGLLNSFSEHLVKTEIVSRETGRLLKRAEEIRLIADYRNHSVELSDAQEIVEQSEQFVTAMRLLIQAKFKS